MFETIVMIVVLAQLQVGNPLRGTVYPKGICLDTSRNEQRNLVWCGTQGR